MRGPQTGDFFKVLLGRFQAVSSSGWMNLESESFITAAVSRSPAIIVHDSDGGTVRDVRRLNQYSSLSVLDLLIVFGTGG